MERTDALSCRPVELDPTEVIDATILKHTFVYSGSVVGYCNGCGTEVWIGPKQQAYQAEHLEVPVVCFRCTITNGLLSQGSTITSLENPETRR